MRQGGNEREQEEAVMRVGVRKSVTWCGADVGREKETVGGAGARSAYGTP